MEITRFLIIGLGSIARRHIRNLFELYPTVEIAVLRQSPNKIEPEISEKISHIFYNMHEALKWNPKAAIICGPASTHISSAYPLAEKKIPILMEKPLTDSLDGVERLIDILKKSQSVFLVAYNFRYYKPLQTLKKILDHKRIGRLLAIRAEVGGYLPWWRPNIDYRKSVSAQRKLGGGALLELSHELDMALWLVGPIKAVTAKVVKLSSLEIDVEDCVDILLEFHNGAIGNIHMDMIDKGRVRGLRIIGEKGTLMWNMTDNSILLFEDKDKGWQNIINDQANAYDEMYRLELVSFIDAIQGKPSELVSIETGIYLHTLIEGIRKSAFLGKTITL